MNPGTSTNVTTGNPNASQNRTNLRRQSVAAGKEGGRG
jgi:hypothetical protein